MKNIFDHIEQKPTQVIVGLLIFHAAVAFMMSWIAHSPFLSHLHNHQGIWYFSHDTIQYHKEAIYLFNSINGGDWSTWWSGLSNDPHIYPNKHSHVKWIALLYWIIEKPSPLTFEIVNSVIWVTSVTLIYLASRILFNQNVMVASFAALYLFFPSILLSSIQLQKDPFYILGFCFVIFGWAAVFHKDSKWHGALAIIIGFFIIVSIRKYVAPVLLPAFALCTIIFLVRKKIALFPAIVMLLSMVIIQQNNAGQIPTDPQSSPTNQSKNTKSKEAHPNQGQRKEDQQNQIQNKKVYELSTKNFHDTFLDIWNETGENSINTFLESAGNDESERQKLIWKKLHEAETSPDNNDLTFISYLNLKLAVRFSRVRIGFINVNKNAKSSIDRTVTFMNLRDLISYFPRGLQIGFLSPFPPLWVSSGTQTGYLGRAIAGIETFTMYFIFIGFFSALLIKSHALKPLAPVFIFSIIFIILLGYTIPNVGAIYRMRQGLLIPFFMIGVYGLKLLFMKKNNYNAE
jgi:hypothetical protein